MRQNKTILIAFAIMAITASVSAYDPDFNPEVEREERFVGMHLPSEPEAKKYLSDNDFFLTYINVPVSNYGNDNQKEILAQARSFQMQAQIYFLQNNYMDEFREVRKSHRLIQQLYQDLLTEYYLKEVEEMLKQTSAVVALAKDKQAEYLLQYGYRLFAEARLKRLHGYNIYLRQHSMKIRQYLQGIDLCRLARKYAIRAMIEAKTPIDLKGDYKRDGAIELADNAELPPRPEYEKLRLEILNLIQRPQIKTTIDFLLAHDDNYGLLGEGKNSVLIDAMRKTASEIDLVPAEKPQTTEPPKTP